MRSDGTYIWRELFAEAERRLATSGVAASPAAEARWIIERASGLEGAEYQLGLDEPVTERGMHFFDLMMERRLAGEPLQYVLGRWGFRTLDLLVDPRVLIPRPETEVVAGLALDEVDRIRAAGVDRPFVVDLGTGSGAIGLSIAAERERVDVVLTDRSSDAVAVATANLAGLGRAATRVTICEGSWFEALDAEWRGRIDVIVSNPPYVADGDVVDAIVREWEPTDALFAGGDGLDDLLVLIAGAGEWLAPGGAIVLEMAPQQVPIVAAMARSEGLIDISSHSDLSGRPRAVVARRSEDV